MDYDKHIRNIEKIYSIGQPGESSERIVAQNLGKIINKDYSLGGYFEEIFGRVERIMKGEKPVRWEGQNKKSETQKAYEKAMKEGW